MHVNLAERTMPELAQFADEYRGFAMVQPEPVVMGEIELVITDSSVTLRYANGKGLVERFYGLTEFTPMTHASISGVWKAFTAYQLYERYVSGFVHNNGAMRLLFLDTNYTRYKNMPPVRLQLGEQYGLPKLCALRGKAEWSDHEAAIQKLNKKCKEQMVARLSANGLVPAA